jgi:hypothetical protein
MGTYYNGYLNKMRRWFKPSKRVFGGLNAMYNEVFGNQVITRGDSNWKITTSRQSFHGKKRQPSAVSDFR